MIITKNIAFFIITLAFLSFAGDEKPVFPEHLQNTVIAKLKENDSLTYYQCYAESVKAQSIITEGGQKIELDSKKQHITITSKYKLYKNGNTYRFLYYSSPTTYYPNKKFAYLKLTEKPYWEFSLQLDTILPADDVLRLAAYETKLRAITEYDFKVLDDNGPQLIINGKKISEQFIVKENLLLTGTLSVLKNGKK